MILYLRKKNIIDEFQIGKSKSALVFSDVVFDLNQKELSKSFEFENPARYFIDLYNAACKSNEMII